MINFVSDVPSARETTTICLNHYNTKKKNRRRQQRKDVKDVERDGWTNNLRTVPTNTEVFLCGL